MQVLIKTNEKSNVEPTVTNLNASVGDKEKLGEVARRQSPISGCIHEANKAGKPKK